MEAVQGGENSLVSMKGVPHCAGQDFVNATKGIVDKHTGSGGVRPRQCVFDLSLRAPVPLGQQF